MTKLYFIRHGESCGNKDRMFQGQLDLDLSQHGYRQAEITADYFNNVHIDAIYSSDLSRAYNTAKAISEASGLPIVKDEALREIFAGKWQGMTFQQITDDYPEAFETWLHDIDNAVCTGGESISQFKQRISHEVDRIASENNGKSVVIVTHAGAIRALESLWLDKPMSGILWVPNASVTVVEYRNNGKASIIQNGFSDHLGKLATAFGADV